MSSGHEETIAIKAIFGDDTRRFTMPSAATFEELRGQIEKRFLIVGKHVCFKFRDDENEWCSLMNDEDLAEAQAIAKQLNPPILRIQINVLVELTDTPAPAGADAELEKLREAIRQACAILDMPFEQIVASLNAFDLVGEAERFKRFFGEHGLQHLFANFTREEHGDHDEAPRAEAVHHGVTCDVSNQCPIRGTRYHKIGEDYDLCEAEFVKLSADERKNFEAIPFPRPAFRRCHGGGWMPGSMRGMFGGLGGRGCGKFGGPPFGGRGFGKKGKGGKGCKWGWFQGGQPQQSAVNTLSARFVADVSLPDGTVVTAGNSFTKTWRLRNDGALPWPETVGLVFVKGDQLHLDNVQAVEAVVPGEEVEVSVSMIAPEAPGRYVSFWRLSAAAEAERDRPHNWLQAPFGQRVWVQIIVSEDGRCDFVEETTTEEAEPSLDAPSKAQAGQDQDAAADATIQHLKEAVDPLCRAFGVPPEMAQTALPMLANLIGSEKALHQFVSKLTEGSSATAASAASTQPTPTENTPAEPENTPIEPVNTPAEPEATNMKSTPVETASVEPTPYAELVYQTATTAEPSPTDAKIKQLNDMGFLDESENRAALEKADGEVHRAIDLLMWESVTME